MDRKNKILNFKFSILNCRRFFNRRLKNFRNFELRTSDLKLAESRLRVSAGGWTLIELMLVMAMIAIITPAITYLFMKVSQGMASDEMHTELQQGNQAMLNRLQVHLAANRHCFFNDNTSGGVSFLTRLNLTTAPAKVAGGVTLCEPQPQPQTTPTFISGSLSPNATGFLSANVGNALLFAAYDAPQTLLYPTGPPKISTAVPITVTGASIVDSNGVKQTAIIDLYRFYFYYLSSAITKQLFDATDYSLIEWQSIQYPDYTEIANYSQDPVLEGNVLAGIKAAGMTVAWDFTQSDPNQAFVAFGTAAYGTNSTSVTALSAGYTIAMDTYNNVTVTRSGILTSGFRYGISPNTNNWKSCPVQIPLYAAVAAPGTAFPNGFEVAASSNPTGRQIMIRSVWVAEGANGSRVRAVYNDLNMVDEISDNW